MNGITFVGLGKLGLPFSLLLDKAKYQVIGVDINDEYVNSLNNKIFSSEEPFVNDMLQQANFHCTTDLKQSLHNKYIFILVNSSVSLDSYYDMNIVSNILSDINKYASDEKHVIIMSTVQIGYIENIGNFLLKNDRYNHTLSYFPEFVRIGKVVEDITQCYTPFLVGSDCEEVKVFINNLLGRVCLNAKPSIHFMSPQSAEIAKLSGNSFKTIKISFSNFIGDICDKTPNTDKHQILQALKSDKLIKEGCFTPGYGYGGPCFPRDNLEFKKYVNSLQLNTCILDATDQYNSFHTNFQANQHIEQNKEEYVFSNVCYRKDSPVPFIEASQKLKVAALVAKSGKKVVIHDIDKVIELVKKQYGNTFTYITKQ